MAVPSRFAETSVELLVVGILEDWYYMKSVKRETNLK
jgi:hypothetical protein